MHSFVVRHGNKDLLTRAGNFQLTAAGRLVTQDGDPVLSDDGNPIEIDPDGGPVATHAATAASAKVAKSFRSRWCGRVR